MRKDETQDQQQDNYSLQELFMESENSCCLCGHDLKFEHQLDFHNQRITEKAQCPGCHIHLSDKEHNLH